MIIETRSGAIYQVATHNDARRGPVLFVRKDGQDWTPVVAIYRDRLPYLMDTVSIEKEACGPCVVGRNAAGRQTFRLIPDQVRPGMILANRRGFRSTEIVKIS